MPRSILNIFAEKYVAGESTEQALNTVNELNEKGFSATIDILGEHVSDIDEANSVVNEYISLYENIQHSGLDCNISIKPTHIGLDISESFYNEKITHLATSAYKFDNFLRIDMEDSSVTDITIDSYLKLADNFSNTGTVFQAYLLRTMEDIKKVQSNNLNLRLCKGIYKESPKIAIQDRKLINKNFLNILKFVFENKGYVGIATHDLVLLEDVYALISKLNVPKDRFEFQVLYGVPMSGWLEKHLDMGYKVRVYVPFGPDWYNYSIRRLKENPNIARYVIKNIFR